MLWEIGKTETERIAIKSCPEIEGAYIWQHLLPCSPSADQPWHTHTGTCVCVSWKETIKLFFMAGCQTLSTLAALTDAQAQVRRATAQWFWRNMWDLVADVCLGEVERYTRCESQASHFLSLYNTLWADCILHPYITYSKLSWKPRSTMTCCLLRTYSTLCHLYIRSWDIQRLSILSPCCWHS